MITHPPVTLFRPMGEGQAIRMSIWPQYCLANAAAEGLLTTDGALALFPDLAHAIAAGRTQYLDPPDGKPWKDLRPGYFAILLLTFGDGVIQQLDRGGCIEYAGDKQTGHPVWLVNSAGCAVLSRLATPLVKFVARGKPGEKPPSFHRSGHDE